MKRKAHKSVHMYKRIAWGTKGRIIYKCVIPGCTHYLHKVLAEGAISLCNRCRNKEVVITKYMISKNIVRIHCDKCTRPTWNAKKIGPEADDIQSKLDKILSME